MVECAVIVAYPVSVVESYQRSYCRAQSLTDHMLKENLFTVAVSLQIGDIKRRPTGSSLRAPFNEAHPGPRVPDSSLSQSDTLAFECPRKNTDVFPRASDDSPVLSFPNGNMLLFFRPANRRLSCLL